MLVQSLSYAGRAQFLGPLSEKAEIKYAYIKSVRGDANWIVKTKSPALDGAKVLIFKGLCFFVSRRLSGQGLMNSPALLAAKLFLFPGLF